MVRWPSGVQEFDAAGQLYRECADLLVQVAQEAIDRRGYFSLVLSGGNTPKGLYRLLAEPKIGGRLDWSKVYVFWGDERCVPPEHSHSNFRMAKEAFLEPLAIPLENIFRMPGELEPAVGAISYEERIARFMAARPGSHNVSGNIPVFDLILLGLGADGHTASLFPGSEVLSNQEHLVRPVTVSKDAGITTRLTLTLPVINGGRNIWFLVTGPAKEEICRQVIFADRNDSEPYPAAMVNSSGNRLRWFVSFV